MKPAYRIVLTVMAGVATLSSVYFLKGKETKSSGNSVATAPNVSNSAERKPSSIDNTTGNSAGKADLSQPGLTEKVTPAQSAAGAGTSQSSSTTTPASTGTATTAQNTAPVVPQPMCYVETFHHKELPGHDDEESCSRHKNLIKLSHSNVNTAHLCVRVNGTPVKFTRQSSKDGDEILIGSIAGPKAKITASYCVGKLTCSAVTDDACSIPKDEFMDALQGADISAADGEPNTHWEGTQAAADTALNNDVKKELADIDGVDSDDSAKGRTPASSIVFKGWINEEDTPACVKKQAS